MKIQCTFEFQRPAAVYKKLKKLIQRKIYATNVRNHRQDEIALPQFVPRFWCQKIS